MRYIALFLFLLILSCNENQPTKEVYNSSPIEAKFDVIGYYPSVSRKFIKDREGTIQIKSNSIIFDIEENTDVWDVNRVFTIDSVTTETILSEYKITDYHFWCRDEIGKRKWMMVSYDTLAYEYKYHPNKNANYIISVKEDEDIEFLFTMFYSRLK